MISRTSSTTNEAHTPSDLIPVPSPVFGLGNSSQTLPGYFCLAPTQETRLLHFLVEERRHLVDEKPATAIVSPLP